MYYVGIVSLDRKRPRKISKITILFGARLIIYKSLAASRRSHGHLDTPANTSTLSALCIIKSEGKSPQCARVNFVYVFFNIYTGFFHPVEFFF